MLVPLGFLGVNSKYDYELISTQILASNAATVTFSAIDQTKYKHLQLRVTGRTTYTGGVDVLTVQFNGDTGANYASHRLQGDGTSATGASFTSQTYANMGFVVGDNSTANIFGASVIDILDAFSATKVKTLRGVQGSNASSNLVAVKSGLWINTASVSSIVLGTTGAGNFMTGSRFSLYGVRG